MAEKHVFYSKEEYERIEQDLINKSNLISGTLIMLQDCSDDVMRPYISDEMFQVIKNRYANLYSEGMECIGYVQAAYDSRNGGLREAAIAKCDEYIKNSLAFETRLWAIILKSLH